MLLVTANGTAVPRGEIIETEIGPWLAHLWLADENNDVASAVTIECGDETWVGTILPDRGSVEAGLFSAQVVGGNNGLTTVLPAKYYFGATLGIILADIMTESGEVFDAASSDPSIADYQVPAWVRAQGEARVALNAVANELGGYWRISRAGQVVMVKDETWAATKDDYTPVQRIPAKCVVSIAPHETPFARPGVTVGSDRIVTTRTVWDQTGLRQFLQVHDGTNYSQDPGQVTMESARRANELATIYGRQYRSKVIAQDADGTLHLMPDDEVVRGFGLTNVAMRHGIPGLTVQVVPGQYVNLFFESGDPKRPAAALWPDGSSVAMIHLGGDAASEAWVKGSTLLSILSQLTVNTSFGPSTTPLNAASFTQFLSTKYFLDS